jgi:aminodeoxyfutalosine deaminase
VVLLHEPRTFAARWVFPVTGPPLERGTVTVCGERIEAVQPCGSRRPDRDLGNVALIPGLVNPHTHLDLSGARGLIPPTDPEHFTDWLRGVIAYRRGRSAEEVQADIAAGLAESLRFGTTLIGDISADGGSWDALSAAQVRATVFREVIGLGDDWQDRYFAAHAWLSTHEHLPNCRKAISPHAPYTVRRNLFDLLAKHCEADSLVVAIHVAESPGEVELIEQRSGSFESFLRGFGFQDCGLLLPSYCDLLKAFATVPALLVHCNYLAADTAFTSNQSVVFCPRTHAAFGHPPHPFREFLRRGVRVCLGTDSLASNPDLDPLAEARFLHAEYPEFSGEALLKMITLAGAESLGWATEAGSLEANKPADLVAVPLPDQDAADPHDLLLADDPGERRTMFRGEWRT